jgi:hypothetical protein
VQKGLALKRLKSRTSISRSAGWRGFIAPLLACQFGFAGLAFASPFDWGQQRPWALFCRTRWPVLPIFSTP